MYLYCDMTAASSHDRLATCVTVGSVPAVTDSQSNTYKLVAIKLDTANVPLQRFLTSRRLAQGSKSARRTETNTDEEPSCVLSVQNTHEAHGTPIMMDGRE